MQRPDTAKAQYPGVFFENPFGLFGSGQMLHLTFLP